MSAKAERRARKKSRRRPGWPACDDCGRAAPSNDGDHDTPLSANGTCWDGFVVVAWCTFCGSDSCS